MADARAFIVSETGPTTIVQGDQMVGPNPGGDLDALVEAVMRLCTQLKGLRSGVVTGWFSPAGREHGTGGFGGPDCPEGLRDDEETTIHLVRLETCGASQPSLAAALSGRKKAPWDDQSG